VVILPGESVSSAWSLWTEFLTFLSLFERYFFQKLSILRAFVSACDKLTFKSIRDVWISRAFGLNFAGFWVEFRGFWFEFRGLFRWRPFFNFVSGKISLEGRSKYLILMSANLGNCYTLRLASFSFTGLFAENVSSMSWAGITLELSYLVLVEGPNFGCETS